MAIYAALAVALPVTVWSIVEAVRARAWGWLVSMVLLWPVGVIAWFVSGRRFYGNVAPTGPPAAAFDDGTDHTAHFPLTIKAQHNGRVAAVRRRDR
jgi:hypothetical protein